MKHRWKRALALALTGALLLGTPGALETAAAAAEGAGALYAAATTRAYTPQDGTYTLEISDGTVTGFTALEGFDGHLVIPEAIEGQAVTTIGANAFAFKGELSSVLIPSGITVIEEGAFQNSHYLTAVTGADGVTTLGDEAFMDCGKLVSVPAFSNLTDMGIRAFSGTGLTSVELPGGLENIPNLAFSNCTALESVKLNEGTVSVGMQSFDGCTSLASINFPATLSELGSRAFQNCGFTSLYVPATIIKYGSNLSGFLYDDTFKGCVKLTDVTIAAPTVSRYMFAGCTALETVTLKDTVTLIQQGAFLDCYALRKIVIPASVETMYTNIFSPSVVVEIHGYPDSVAEEYAERYGFPFVDMTMQTQTRTLSVSVRDPAGQPVSEGVDIVWYRSGQQEAVGTDPALSGAAVDAAYDFEVILSEALAALYEQPARQTIAPADPAEAVVELTPKTVAPTLTLSGKVLDAEGTALSGVLVTAEQMGDDSAQPMVAQTDADGEFSLEVPAQALSVRFSKDGFYTDKQTLLLAGTTEERLDLGTTVLYKTVSDRIELKLTLSSAVREGDVQQIQPLLSAAGLQFRLTCGEKELAVFTDYEVQGTSLVFLPDVVRAGQVITVAAIDPTGRTQAEPVDVTLDANRVGSGEIRLAERGSFMLGDLSGATPARVLVFDSEGNYLTAYTASSGLQSDPLPAGAYTLAVFQSMSALRSVPALPVLSQLGLEAGTDYALVSLSVQDAKVMETGDIHVPQINADAFSYTDPGRSGILLGNTQVNAGTGFLVEVRYALRDGLSLQPGAMELHLPAGVTPMGALTLNGSNTPYQYDEESNMIRVSLPGNESSGYAALYCSASATGDGELSAYLTLSDQSVQPLGNARLRVSEAQMEAPERTATETVTVFGKAVPGSVVTVYDGGTEMGQAEANAVGSWSLTLDLDNTFSYSYHFLQARITPDNGEPVLTEETLVVYDGREYGAELSKITMFYTDDMGIGQSMSFAYPTTEEALRTVPFYYVTPGRFPTVTFQVEFTGDNSALESVYVMTRNQAGAETYVPTAWDGSAWVGTWNYSTMASLPAEIGAVYVFRETPPQQFSQERFIHDAGEIIQLYEQMEDAFAEEDYWGEQPEYMIAEEGTVLEDDHVILQYYYPDPEQGNIPAFTYEADMKADTRSAAELVDSGYYPIDEEQTIYNISRYQLENSSWSSEYVDTAAGISVTETYTLAVSAGQETEEEKNQLTACAPLSKSGRDWGWDISEEWADRLASFADLLTLVPGRIGTLADVTKSGVEFAGQAIVWYQTISGNAEIIDRSLTELDQLMEIRCPDGSRKLSDGEYASLKGLLYDVAGKTNTYKTKCTTYVSVALAIQAAQVVFSIATEVDAIGDKVKQIDALVTDKMPDWLGPLKEYRELKAYWNQRSVSIGWGEEGLGDWMEKITWAGSSYAVENFSFLSNAKAGAEMLEEWITVGLDALGLNYLTIGSVDHYIHSNYKEVEDALLLAQREIRNALRQAQCTEPEPGDGSGLGGENGFDGTYESMFAATGVFRSPSYSMTGIFDPSGYVYEAVPSNRLEDVKATVYYQDENGGAIQWDAENYDQLNPQITGADGAYAWFVPEGQWKVRFTKDGYLPADSSGVAAAAGNTGNRGWLPVPPPQFEVNVAMVSAAAPAVEGVTAYTDRIEVVFSQYMDLESVKSAIALTRDGESVPVTVEPLDAEYNLEGTTQYATRFAVTPAGGDCTGTLTVAAGAQNYAGTALEQDSATELSSPVQRPTAITAEDCALVLHEAGELPVTLAGGAAGTTLTVESLTPSLLTVSSQSVTTGADGTAAISLTGSLPGVGRVRVTEPVSGLSGTFDVTVVMTEEDLPAEVKPEPVTAKLSDGTAVTTGMSVEKGTQITLSTAAEGATIRYTLNDTCPCKEEALTYTGPISITEDTVLRAAAVLDGVYSDTIRLELTVKTEQPGGGTGGGGSSTGGGGGGSVDIGEDDTPLEPAPSESFTDISGHWAEEAILSAVEAGLFTGTGETTFSPDMTLSRAMFTTVLWRAAGSPKAEGTSAFTDVAQGAWYHDAVAWSAENGIVQGVAQGVFAPDDQITREQMAAMLYRYAQAAGGATDSVQPLTGFADGDSVSAWAADAMAWAVDRGCLTGKPGSLLDPQGIASRAEAAVILLRFLDQ